MRHLIFLMLLNLIFFSCAPPKTTISHKEELNHPHIVDMLVLYVESGNDIFEWGEEAYNEVLKGKFNSLDRTQFRKSLHKKFSRRFQPTFIHEYSNYFSEYKNYSYEEFVEILEANNIKHILLIDLKSDIQIPSNSVTHAGPVTVNNRFRSFQVYLLENGNERPIWATCCLYPRGFGKLQAQLSRKVYRLFNEEELLLHQSTARNSK